MKKQEREYLSKLVNFGCVVCKRFHGVYTEPSIHHIREGMGMGQRNNTENCLPLCPQHHQHGGHGIAFHAGKKAFEETYCSESELLDWLKERL